MSLRPVTMIEGRRSSVKCEKLLEMISPYLDGELQEEEKEEFLAHLEQCPQCKKEVEELEQLLHDFSEIPEVELPDGFHEELMAKIKDSVVVPISIQKKKNTPWRKIIAVAAVFAIVVLAGGGIQELSKETKKPLQQSSVADGEDQFLLSVEFDEDEKLEGTDESEVATEESTAGTAQSETKPVEPGVSTKTMQKKPMGNKGTMVSADLSVISAIVPTDDDIILIDEEASEEVQDMPEEVLEVAVASSSDAILEENEGIVPANETYGSGEEVFVDPLSPSIAVAEYSSATAYDEAGVLEEMLQRPKDSQETTVPLRSVVSSEGTQAAVEENVETDEPSLTPISEEVRNTEIATVHMNIETDTPMETAQQIEKLASQYNGVVIKGYLSDASSAFAEENLICLKLPKESTADVLESLTQQGNVTKMQHSRATLSNEYDKIVKDRIVLEQMRQEYKTAMDLGDTSTETAEGMEWATREKEKLDYALLSWENEKDYFAVYILLEGPGTGSVGKPEIQPPNMKAVTYAETNVQEVS